MNEPIPSQEQEISLRDVYLILRRNIVIILIVPAVFAVLAAIYAYFIADPVYKSESNLTIQTTPVQSKIESQIETSAIAVFTSDQIETLATSRPILDKLIALIKTSNNAPTNWRVERFDAGSLEKKLKVKFPKPNARGTTDASLVTLEVSAPDAKLAAEVANAWARETNVALNQLPQERVKDSINTLQGEVTRASQALSFAEKTYQDFNDKSNLSLNQAELSSATTERASLDPLISQTQQGLIQTRAELGQRNKDLSVASSTVGVTADATQALGVVTNGQTLAQVKRTLGSQVISAQQRMLTANEALRQFNATNDAPLLRGRIAQNETRMIEINAKLQSFASSSKTLSAQLQQAQASLKNQPALLSLQQELLSNPVITAAIQAQDPKLADLVGLQLQSQEVNPLYRDLLQKIITTQSDIRSLNAEQEGIRKEQVSRNTQLEADRKRLAQLNKLADPIALEARAAQSAYENARAQASRLEGIQDSQLQGISVENTNPEYQRLRTLVNDLGSSETRLNVTLQGYQTRAKQLDSRINSLKQQVVSDGITSARIAQELDLSRAQYKALSQKIVDLRIEQASSKTLAQVLVPAFAATQPEQSRSLVVLLAIVAGLLIGLIIPFILEALRDPNAQLKPARRIAPALAAED